MKKTNISDINDIFDEYLRNNNIEKVKSMTEGTDNTEWDGFSSNIALLLAKSLKKNPMALAKSISKNINSVKIKKIAGTNPRFINVFLSDYY